MLFFVVRVSIVVPFVLCFFAQSGMSMFVRLPILVIGFLNVLFLLWCVLGLFLFFGWKLGWLLNVEKTYYQKSEELGFKVKLL